jgi:saccharopine dehydrogenase (NAD+, L-lysine-forming)
VNARAVGEALAGPGAVLSCLTYARNKEVASTAHARGLPYFDLTENVGATKHIRALAKTAKAIMALQCGLAPGFVGIAGAHLAQQFERVRSIHLRVGALPRHPIGLLGYVFNWSPEGSSTNISTIARSSKRAVKTVSAMEWLETIYVDMGQTRGFYHLGWLRDDVRDFRKSSREPRREKSNVIRAMLL